MALASRAFADQLLLGIPAALTILLMHLRVTPTLAPIVYMPDPFIISLFFWRIYYPSAMPYIAVFGIGLINDFLTGTPLGSYALSGLFMVLSFHQLNAQIIRKPFRIVWLMACAYVVIFAGLLTVTNFIAANSINTEILIKTSLASMLIYPVWHELLRLFLRLMPAGLSRS